MTYKYTIGGKEYEQKQLVLGQYRQLSKALKTVSIPVDATMQELVTLVIGELPEALAIVLNPAGVALKDKDIPALTTEISFSIEAEQALQVITDFFACNRTPSLLQALHETIDRIREGMSLKTPQNDLSQSSRPET